MALEIGDLVTPKEKLTRHGSISVIKAVDYLRRQYEIENVSGDPVPSFFWNEWELDLIRTAESIDHEINPFQDVEDIIKQTVKMYINNTMDTDWSKRDFDDFSKLKEVKIKADKINLKEGNNMLKILEIYQNRKIAEIEAKTDKMLDDIEFDDPIQKIVREATAKMKNEIKAIYKDEKDEKYEQPIAINCKLSSIGLTNKTIAMREELIKKLQEEKEEIYKKIDAIEALLELAPNYEEKMKILRDYDIIDKKKDVLL